MTSVIGFMTSTLFCRTCPDSLKCNGDSLKCNGDSWKCDGWIDCHWLSPHDEANCPQQCPSSRFVSIKGHNISIPWRGPIPCACNKPLGNMTCEGWGPVCYRESGKLLVLFYFCKRHNG